jgi:hypothetical protein
MHEVELPGTPSSTNPSLSDVLTELQEREPIFHRRELGTTRADFEAITAVDFWEVGASGEAYSRQRVWATLERRYADPDYWVGDVWETSDFLCRQVAPDAYLLTYRLHQAERVTRRLTVWKRTSDGGEIVYHQGTVVSVT